MKRRRLIFGIFGVALLLFGAVFIRRSRLPHVNALIVAGNCHTPATILEPPTGVTTVGTAILLHGLGANRRTMNYLGADLAGHGLRTYLLDLPGHGDNEDPFSFAKAEACANATVDSLIRKRQIDPATTILVGHSMGGAIAIRMADREPVAATIAISPAPLVLPQRMPSNLLIFSGGFDLWPMKQEAKVLLAAAGGERTHPSDFSQRRAINLDVIPHATHTSLITDGRVASDSELWTMETLFPRAASRVPTVNLGFTTYNTFQRGQQRLVGSLLGLVGLIFLFPAAVAVAGTLSIPSNNESIATETAPAHTKYLLLIVEQAVCALVAVLILAVFIPLRFLHLYDGDYLASLLLVSGALVLIMNWKYVRANSRVNVRAPIVAVMLAFAAFLTTGAWLNWQLADLWMNAPRWLRFGSLLPACFLFCFAEEIALGPVGGGKHRITRFVVFLFMRLELWLACILAYYELESGRALLGVLVTGLAIFSILQRLASDSLRTRTRSALAAAVFGAILASWFIAAVFPLT
ncbi:MAG TPA: alpha/beta fold hydrolase [Candidatus Acidoferrales bacterium]|jgi:pimeloyl-ACP methyl ester carboxylesterase|nr:alpha/beta fold hydrolase [Candidatus Acidoferrales bacterium]